MDVSSSPSRYPADSYGVPLAGSQGDLVSVSVVVEPRELEHLLDRLGESQYPIDPQIQHGMYTLVEFPAYTNWLDEIRRLLDGRGTFSVRQCFACVPDHGN